MTSSGDFEEVHVGPARSSKGEAWRDAEAAADRIGKPVVWYGVAKRASAQVGVSRADGLQG